MKKYVIILFSLLYLFPIDAQISRKIISTVNELYVEEVGFTLKELQFKEDTIKNNLCAALEITDSSAGESKWSFHIYIDSFNDSHYTVFHMPSFSSGEKALGYFKLGKYYAILFGKSIPPFLTYSKNKKSFRYTRQYYKAKNKYGEEVELDVMLEDDGDFYELTYGSNQFSVLHK